MSQLEDKLENDHLSDGSDYEKDHAQKQINEKVDGLAQYEQNLPLSRIKYNDYMEALKSNSGSQLTQVSKDIQSILQSNPNWKNEEGSDFDIKKLFETELFKDEYKFGQIDWKVAKLVGLYICKQSKNTRSYLIANHVAKEAMRGDKMQPDKLARSIGSILKIAAIDFTKAVLQTGYMDNPYDDSVYKKLESGIEKICEYLKQ